MPWEENNNCEGCLESEGVLNAASSVMSLVASKALSRFLNDSVLMLSLFSLTVPMAFWARSRLGGV